MHSHRAHSTELSKQQVKIICVRFMGKLKGPVYPWLHAQYPEPPMPTSQTEYDSLLIDPACIESNEECGEAVLVTCKKCFQDLRANRVPAKAIVNHNYIGPVPEELKGLTVVEETMVALCRVDYPAQRRRVEWIDSACLPPSIEDIITPICVIFVGSKPPTAEWLRTKATPLIVRKEKVMNTLSWLKAHNHLYKDVAINTQSLANLEPETVLLVHIQHIVPSAATDATVSDYVPTMNEFNNPNLFPMMYPTLFPYGLGGLEYKGRRSTLGFKTRIKHLFSLADRRFQEHYSFLFTAFNMLQRRAILLRTSLRGMCCHCRVGRNDLMQILVLVDSLYEQGFQLSLSSSESTDRVLTITERDSGRLNGTSTGGKRHATELLYHPYKCSNFDRVAAQFRTVSPTVVHTVAVRVSKGDCVTANSPEERRVLTLMKEVNIISGHAPGSAQSNFYLTINPADIYHLLVKFLASSEIDLDHLKPQDISDSYIQGSTIACNPSLTARFFNLYMKVFISTLLVYDPKQENTEGGLIMAVFAGALNPDEIKACALSYSGAEEFQAHSITYLDNVISDCVPPNVRPDLETPLDRFHPCTTCGPGTYVEPHDMEDTEAQEFHRLGKRCQAHSHTHNCYKYWKGYPSPKESGPAAKAILYYIKDYITKSLQMHVAHAALEVAVAKFGD
ncbi:hypothetical protein B0H17DRAFT_1126243 [Mycena rosella]|uniref:DUF6570 domain-containing protein n=1 Tax=Mycena rosella TaxID=1033263 RepID=A0AAD7M889_MYCRO|nr:hypothetical protein B0H17DRAFT_1126243 [Mycena rosella]